MTIYQKKANSMMSWVFGFIVFLFAMTVTFSEVSGVGVPRTDKAVNQQFDKTNNTNEPAFQPVQSEDTYGDNNNPVPVPEPSTLILLASGLGVIRLIQRRHKK